MAWSPERLIDEVDLLGARGLPRKEFFAELAPRLRNVIDNDASCWHTLDPHTRLMTSDSPDELVERGVFAPDETSTSTLPEMPPSLRARAGAPIRLARTSGG